MAELESPLAVLSAWRGGGVPVALLGLLCPLLRPHGHYSVHDVVTVGTLSEPGLSGWSYPWSGSGSYHREGSHGTEKVIPGALLGACLGSVVPLIGTAIGAVIGSGWRAKPVDTAEVHG